MASIRVFRPSRSVAAGAFFVGAAAAANGRGAATNIIVWRDDARDLVRIVCRYRYA